MATEAETKEPMSEAVSINDAINYKGDFFEDTGLQCESFDGGKLGNEGSKINVETVNEANERHAMGSDEKITSDNITFKDIADVTEAHTEEKGNKSHDETVNYEKLEKEETEATNENLKDKSINYSTSDTEPLEKENTNEPIEIDNSKTVKREMTEQEEENLEKVIEAKEVEIRASDIKKQEVISIAEPREVEQKPDITVLTFQEPKDDNQHDDDEPGKGNNESNLNTRVSQNPLILRETPDKVDNSKGFFTTENQREINETSINHQGTEEENVQTDRTDIDNQELDVESMNSDKEYQAMSEDKEVLLEYQLKNDICEPERSEVKNDKNSANETSGMNLDGIVGENDIQLKSEGIITSPDIYEIAKEEEETVSKEETKDNILEISSVTMEETTIKEVVSINDPANSEGYILEDTDLQKLVVEKLEKEGYLTENGTNLEEACEVKVETEREVAEKHAMEIDEKKTSVEITFEDITDVTEEHSEEKRNESHDEMDNEKLEKEKIEAKYGILNDENINNFGSTSGAEPSEKENTKGPIEINTSNICITEATEQEEDTHEKVIVKEKVEVEAGTIKMQKLESTSRAEPTEIAQKPDLDVLACQESEVANQHDDDEIGKGGNESNLNTGDSQSPPVLQETLDQVGDNENVFSTTNEKEIDVTINYQGTTEGNAQIEKTDIDYQDLDVEAIEFDKEVLLEDQHRNDMKNEKNSGNETSGMDLDGIVGDCQLKSEGKIESSDIYEIAKEEEQTVPKEEIKDSISESSPTTKEETAIKEDEEYLDGSEIFPALTKTTQAEYVQENDTNSSYDTSINLSDGINQDELKEKQDKFTSLNTGNEMQIETNLYETNDTNETSGANSFEDKGRMARNTENSIENQLQQNCPDVFFDSLSAELESVREIRNEETCKENTLNTSVGAPSIVATKVSQKKGEEISSKDTEATDTDFATLNEALSSDKSSQEMNIHDDHEYKEEKRLKTLILKEELEENSTNKENGIGTEQEFYEASETMETNKNEISKDSVPTEKYVEKEISNGPHLHESVTEVENTHVNEMEKEAIQAEKDKESGDEDLKDIDPITSINDNLDLHVSPALITEEMDGADLQMADDVIKKPEKEEAITVSAEQKSEVANQCEDDEIGKGSDESNLHTGDFRRLPVSQEMPDQVGDNKDVSRTKNEKEINGTINYQGTTKENVQTEKTDIDNQELDVEAVEFDKEYQTAMSGNKEILQEDQLKNETCVTESVEVKNAKGSSGGTSRKNFDETVREIDCQLQSEGKFDSSIVYETVKDEAETMPKEGTKDNILESSSTAKDATAIIENEEYIGKSEDIPALTKTTQAEYLQDNGTNSSYDDQTSASISLNDGLRQDEKEKNQDEFTSLKIRNEMETEPNLYETNDTSETSGANSFNDKESIERNIGNNPDVFLNSWTAESELEAERENPSEGTHKEDISNACVRAPSMVTVNMSEDKGEEIIYNYNNTKAGNIDFATLGEALSSDRSLQEMSIQGDHEHKEEKKLEKILIKEELEDNSTKKENETITDKSFYEANESMEINKTKTSKEGVATERNVEKEISNDLHLHETVTEAKSTHVNEKDATRVEEDEEFADEDLKDIDFITNKSDNLNIHKVPALITEEMDGPDLHISDDLTKKTEKEEAINVTAEKANVNIDERFVVEEIDSEVISVEAGTSSENERKEKHEIEARSENKELEDEQLTIENRIQTKYESINSSNASETKENEGFEDKEYTEEDNSEKETLEYTDNEKSPFVVLQDLKTTTKAKDIQDIESENRGLNNNETTEASVNSNTEAILSNSALKEETEHLANQLPEKEEAANITTEEDILTELVSHLPNEAEDSSVSLKIDLESEKNKNIDTKLEGEKIEDTAQEEENDKQELPESHVANEASELDEIIIVKGNENADKENYSTKNFSQCEDTIVVDPIIESEPKHLTEEDYEGEVVAARDYHLHELMIEEKEEKDDMHKELKDTQVEPKIDLRTMDGEKEDSSDKEINITENAIKENLDVHARSQEQRQEQHIENKMPTEMTTYKSCDVSESNENESNKEKGTADDAMLKFERTTGTQDVEDVHEITRITESVIKEEENDHTRSQEEEHKEEPHAENEFLAENAAYKSCDANESNETESIKEKEIAEKDTVNPEELELTENDDVHESEIMDTHTDDEDNLQYSEHVIPETEIDSHNQNTDSILNIDNKLSETGRDTVLVPQIHTETPCNTRDTTFVSLDKIMPNDIEAVEEEILSRVDVMDVSEKDEELKAHSSLRNKELGDETHTEPELYEASKSIETYENEIFENKENTKKIFSEEDKLEEKEPEISSYVSSGNLGTFAETKVCNHTEPDQKQETVTIREANFNNGEENVIVEESKNGMHHVNNYEDTIKVKIATPEFLSHQMAEKEATKGTDQETSAEIKSSYAKQIEEKDIIEHEIVDKINEIETEKQDAQNDDEHNLQKGEDVMLVKSTIEIEPDNETADSAHTIDSETHIEKISKMDILDACPEALFKSENELIQAQKYVAAIETNNTDEENIQNAPEVIEGEVLNSGVDLEVSDNNDKEKKEKIILQNKEGVVKSPEPTNERELEQEYNEINNEEHEKADKINEIEAEKQDAQIDDEHNLQKGEDVMLVKSMTEIEPDSETADSAHTTDRKTHIEKTSKVDILDACPEALFKSENELTEDQKYVTTKETNDTDEENIQITPEVIEDEALNSCVDLEVSDNNDEEKKENIILQNKEEVGKSLEPTNERELEQEYNDINNEEREKADKINEIETEKQDAQIDDEHNLQKGEDVMLVKSTTEIKLDNETADSAHTIDRETRIEKTSKVDVLDANPEALFKSENELIEARKYVMAKEMNDTGDEDIQNAPEVIECEVINSCVDLEVSDNNDKKMKENNILHNKEEVVKSLEPANERELEQEYNEINNEEDTLNGEDKRTELAAGFNHAIQSSNSVYDNEEGWLAQEAFKKDEVYKGEATIGAYDKSAVNMVIAIPENENKDRKTEGNEASIDLKGFEVATETKNIHGGEIKNDDATNNNGKFEGELDATSQDKKSIYSDLEAVTTSEEVKDVDLVCQEDMHVEGKNHCTQEENSKVVVDLEKENIENRDNSANLQKEELHEKPREELDGNPRDREDKNELQQAEQKCFESCNTSNIYDNESFPERESVAEEELNDQKPENICTLIPKDFNATVESTIEKETTEFSDEKHMQKEEDTTLVESATNEESANESNKLVCSTVEASIFEEAKNDKLTSQIGKEMAHDVALNGNEDPLHNNIQNDNRVFHEGIPTEASEGHENKSSIERDPIFVESAKIATVSEEKDVDEEHIQESEMININMSNAKVQESQPQNESLELENVGKVEQSESIMGTENTETNTALSIKNVTADAKLINEDKAETDTGTVPVDKVKENNDQLSKQSNSLSNDTEMEADDSFSKISNYWPINYGEEALNVNKMETVEVDEKTGPTLKLVHDKYMLQEQSLQEPDQNQSEQAMETEQLLDTKARPEIENDNLQEEYLPFSQFLMKHILMNESDSLKTSNDEEIGDISKNKNDKHDIDISRKDEKLVPSLIVEPMHHASIVDEGAGFHEKLEENKEAQVDDNCDVKDNLEVIDNNTEMFTTELPVSVVEQTQNTSITEYKAINEKPRENNEVQVDDNCDVKDDSEIIDDKQETFTMELPTSVVEQTRGTSIAEDKSFNEKPQENTEIQVDDKCDVKDNSELVDNKKECFTKQLPMSIIEQIQYTSIAEDKAINQKPNENNRVQLDDKSDVHDYSEVTDDKKEFPATGLPITVDNSMIESEFGTCICNEEDMQNDVDTPKQEGLLVPKDMQTDVDTPKQEDLLVPKSNVEQNGKPKDDVVSENTLNSYDPVQAEESSDVASDSETNFVKNEDKEDDINNTLSEQSSPAVKDEEHIVFITADRKIQEIKENSPNLMMDEQIYEKAFEDIIAEKNILQRKDCSELEAKKSEITETEKQEQILNYGLKDEKTEAGLQKHQQTSLVFEPETALGNQDLHKYMKENEKERTKFEAPTLSEGKANLEIKPVKNVGDNQDIFNQKKDSTEEQKLSESQKTQEVNEKNTDDEYEKQDADEHDREDYNHDETNVESRDTNVNPTKKKSHGILSGVGSKVKRSIIKVKKAITGKSSHSETQLAK